MDSRLRKLERLAAMGDTRAAEKRNWLLSKRRTDNLKPCIRLCPRGTNVRFKGGYLRLEYISILLDMGDWRNLPVVRNRFGAGYRLHNGFFLSSFKKHERTD
jgi:hypothetical protein